MNNVNKDNAIGLKEIGFDEDAPGYYKDGIPSIYHSEPENSNRYDGLYAAPDFLSAADWFYEKHNIEIALYPNTTVIYLIESDGMSEFRTGDHRNAAFAAAIKMVKQKPNNP